MSDQTTRHRTPPRSAARSQAPEWRAQLLRHTHRYDFFQAVRLFSTAARRGAQQPVGHDYTPREEVVRFRGLASHAFPPGHISRIAESKAEGPPELTVSFLGLFGPAGALPQHYTQTVIDRLRLKDRSLRDFLDLFNHRLLSHFYRAWEKHHVPAQVESAAVDGRPGDDLFTSSLLSTVGLGAPSLRDRLEADDATFIYYSGLYAHHPRNAQSLERMVAEVLGLRTEVLQFQGQWLTLAPEEQTSFPSLAAPNGLNCRLGESAIAGERVWSIESKFRLRVGPMGYDDFANFLPGATRLIVLGQLVRMYVGPELDFDIQPVIRREEVPGSRLGGPGGATQLGWNSWVHSGAAASDADDAVFVSEGLPTR